VLFVIVCFAKTRPDVRFGGHPGEGLSNQTLAGLVALWSMKWPRFTRGINPLEHQPSVLLGVIHTSVRSKPLYHIEHV